MKDLKMIMILSPSPWPFAVTPTCISCSRECPAPGPGYTLGQTPAPTPPSWCSLYICWPGESPPGQNNVQYKGDQYCAHIIASARVVLRLSDAFKYIPNLFDWISELIDCNWLWVVHIKDSKRPLNLLGESLCVTQINCLKSFHECQTNCVTMNKPSVSPETLLTLRYPRPIFWTRSQPAFPQSRRRERSLCREVGKFHQMDSSYKEKVITYNVVFCWINLDEPVEKLDHVLLNYVGPVGQSHPVVLCHVSLF